VARSAGSWSCRGSVVELNPKVRDTGGELRGCWYRRGAGRPGEPTADGTCQCPKSSARATWCFRGKCRRVRTSSTPELTCTTLLCLAGAGAGPTQTAVYRNIRVAPRCQCPKSSARLTCGLRGSCRRVWTSVCLYSSALMSTLFGTPVHDGKSRDAGRAAFVTKNQVSQDTSRDDPTLAPTGSEHVQGTTDIRADDFGH